MTKPKAPPQPGSISIDPNPKGEFKMVGGSLTVVFRPWLASTSSTIGRTIFPVR